MGTKVYLGPGRDRLFLRGQEKPMSPSGLEFSHVELSKEFIWALDSEKPLDSYGNGVGAIYICEMDELITALAEIQLRRG